MTSSVENQDEVTFEEFCEEWLREFREGDLSPFEKGQGFAVKLVTQWLGVTGDDEDLVLCDGSGDALQGLLDSAVEVIDIYLNQESEDSVYEEPGFQGGLNTFLKREQLGKNEDSTPFFKSLLSAHKVVFGRRSGGQPSPRELVTQAIQGVDD